MYYHTEGRTGDFYVQMKKHNFDYLEENLRVHYRIIGNGDMNIVFIPGLSQGVNNFRMQYEFFKENARSIYIDLPGHGLSDAPMSYMEWDESQPEPVLLKSGFQYNFAVMADAIYTVVKKEKMDNFVVVGHSLGAKVLGEFERKYPSMMTKMINLDGLFHPWFG